MSVHRTRNRSGRHLRAADAPAEPAAADATEIELAELAVLWPRLEAAIARDTAGPSAAPSGGSGGGQGSPAPVDLDTERVVTLIEVGVHQLEAEAIRLLNITPPVLVIKQLRAQIAAAQIRRATGRAAILQLRSHLAGRATKDDPAPQLTLEEKFDAEAAVKAVMDAQELVPRLRRRIVAVEERRSTAGVIGQLPLWYAQLRDRKQPLAGHIAADARRWHRDARTVLRLRTREQPIGWTCPHHRDEPAELVRDRDEATLAPAVLAGQQPRNDAPLRWKFAESVHCPRCSQKWVGVEQLRALMKMIDQVEEDGRMRQQVLDVVRSMAVDEPTAGYAPLHTHELALLDAIGVEVRTCSGGCGCRRATYDPDDRDCACDKECTAPAELTDEQPVDPWFDLELALPEQYRKASA